MAAITQDIVPLNRTEHGYVALEGLAATMVQPYLMRLSAPVEAEQVKRVLRQLVTAYPKLRAVIEPGLHFYHFRILPDNEVVDQLFELAFKVEPHIDVDDPQAAEHWHWRCQQHVFPLERGLGLRAWFVPHPQRPALMFAMPHIFGDGMTMIHLLKLVMQGLNGQPMEAMPVEAPSMIGSIAPDHWWQWPAKMWRARQHKVAERQLLAQVNVQQIPRKVQPNYSTTGLSHGTLPVPVAEVRKAARHLGASVNTFATAAIAQTFLEQAPDDPKPAAVIRTSAVLRRSYPKSAGHGPLWGNHVGAFLVIEQGVGKSVLDRVKSVDAHMKEGLARYARREMCWTYLMEELIPLLGRTLIGYIGITMQRANRFPQISAHATSLGNAGDYFNPKGAAIQVDSVMAAVTSVAPIMVLVEEQGALRSAMMWQLAETSADDIADFRHRLGLVMRRMTDEVLASIPQAA